VFRRVLFIALTLAALGAAVAGPVAASSDKVSFGFNAPRIAGFPSGAVALTGGGIASPFGEGHAGGSFDCLETVNQGPLAGCFAGQGVRWDTAAVLRATSFKCTGAPTERLKSIALSDATVILVADFYRAGDGNDESFTAQMIVSSDDIAPDLDGFQNVWVQGVGCGTAGANVNGRLIA
jgi:hypothetical protein